MFQQFKKGVEPASKKGDRLFYLRDPSAADPVLFRQMTCKLRLLCDRLSYKTDKPPAHLRKIVRIMIKHRAASILRVFPVCDTARKRSQVSDHKHPSALYPDLKRHLQPAIPVLNPRL